MRGPEFLARLREEVLVGDGAVGTMISERGVGRDACYERLNLTNPEAIQEIHRAYLAAGAVVIETNTFGANRTKLTQQQFPDEIVAINRAGVSLAREVAGQRAYVAGSVGPLASLAASKDVARLTDDDVRAIFREQIVALADAGADLLFLETFSDLHQLLLALEVARTQVDLPVVCQLAFHERGHTYAGVHVGTAVDALTHAKADVIGANCGRGVRCVAKAVAMMTARTDLPVSAYPNAGLPEYVEGRYLFGAPLPYLVDSAVGMVEHGANLIGGCCGTTPAYVARLAERLKGRKPAKRVRVAAELKTTVVESSPSAVSQSPPRQSILHDREKGPLIVVELDPPRDLNHAPVVQRALQLRDMGVDAITMGDNTVATLRMSNVVLAHIVQQEADVPVVFHLTCRDHNVLGLQSLLMGAHALKLNHVLALTGDPARHGDQPGVTDVYELSSMGLIELVAKFNRGINHAGTSIGQSTEFTIGVAFNPNGRNLAAQVDRLRRKVARGAHFAMTQPIFDPVRFQEMKAMTADLGIPILVGIMPLLSERNAEFLHNEVPGICLPDTTRQRMKGLSGKPGRDEGLRICKELIEAMAWGVDGFYLIPPQVRTEMAVELVDFIHQRVGRP